MRKHIPFAALALLGAAALAGCNKGGEEAAKPAAQAVQQEVKMPTDATNTQAWKAYLVDVVKRNMQGVTSRTPYMYFVPAGDDTAAQDARINQLENVKTTVARGVLPGNMMAFGGPSSTLTAGLIQDAFKEAQAGSFKGVIVLFIGAPADKDAVEQALGASGAVSHATCPCCPIKGERSPESTVALMSASVLKIGLLSVFSRPLIWSDCSAGK